MNISEKLKELGIEKEQLIIFGVIGVVVVFILYGIFSSGTVENEIISMEEIEMPENKTKKEYKTKLDAYARENEKKENNYSLDFDRDLLEEESLEKTKKQKLEEKIDSMLNAKSPQENIQPKRNVRPPTYSSSNHNIAQHRKKNERLANKHKAELKQKKIDEERKKIERRKRAIASIQASFNNSNNKELKKTDKNIPIMINGDQMVKEGSRVKMLLQKDAIINGKIYKRNTKIYGFVKFAPHRLFININNINKDPVKLKIYDAEDGSIGLYTKENLIGEVGQEVTSDQVDEINIQGVKVGQTIKKIFKNKQKEPKLPLFNRTKFIMN